MTMDERNVNSERRFPAGTPVKYGSTEPTPALIFQ
jgi:hypothetical protein